MKKIGKKISLKLLEFILSHMDERNLRRSMRDAEDDLEFYKIFNKNKYEAQLEINEYLNKEAIKRGLKIRVTCKGE